MPSNNQTTLYEKVLAVFQNMDLDWEDISENIDQCSNDEERIGVLIRWMDARAWDEEWKVDVLEAARSIQGGEETVKSMIDEAGEIVSSFS